MTAPLPSVRERRLAAAAHATGVLGVSVVGWGVAAVASFALLLHASRERSIYAALHAGQAALYQLLAFAIHALLAVCFVVGFLHFAGDIPGLPTLTLMDLPEPWFTLVPILWLAVAVAIPLWYVASLALAARGARRALAGGEFWYPVVGGYARRLDPRYREAAVDSAAEDEEDEEAAGTAV